MKMVGLLYLLGLGCSDGDRAVKSGGDKAAADEDSFSADTGFSAMDESYDVIDGWRLGDTLFLDDEGQISEESEIQVEFVGMDSSERDRVCVAVSKVATLDDTGLPDPAIISWWNLRPVEWSGCLEQMHLINVEELGIGIGELHHELLAVLDNSPLSVEGSSDSLNGAYASIGGGQVYVFGVAGLAQAYEGVGNAAVQTPLVSGEWAISALYQFSLTRQ